MRRRNFCVALGASVLIHGVLVFLVYSPKTSSQRIEKSDVVISLLGDAGDSGASVKKESAPSSVSSEESRVLSPKTSQTQPVVQEASSVKPALETQQIPSPSVDHVAPVVPAPAAVVATHGETRVGADLADKGVGTAVGVGTGLVGAGSGTGRAGGYSSPRYLRNPAPMYPELAKKEGVTGQVIVRVRIDTTGDPVEVLVGQGSGSRLLDDAAVLAVRQWRFLPAKQNGSAVEVWADVPIRFQLK